MKKLVLTLCGILLFIWQLPQNLLGWLLIELYDARMNATDCTRNYHALYLEKWADDLGKVKRT